MNFLLDTNTLLHYLRKDKLSLWLGDHLNPLQTGTFPAISIATLGEIKSLSLQFQWGGAKVANLETFLRKLLVLNIRAQNVLARYAEIDAFSQNKMPERPLAGTARKMGKNDLWIAATASVLERPLLTTDHDFDHLDGVFLKLERVSPIV